MLRFLSIISILIMTISLNACTVAKPKQKPVFTPKPTQAELHARAAAQWVNALRQNNVQVIHVGESMRLIIPSDPLFIQRSSNFNQHYVYVLNQVAALLQELESTSVSISGYTDDLGSFKHNYVVSERQAQKVMRYLWSKGLDARLMVARGFGAEHPIAINRTSSGRLINRRIEIKFQYVPLHIS